MVEYNKVNVKLSDSHLEKLKNSVKNKTGTTLRIILKCFMKIIYHMNCYCQQYKKKKKIAVPLAKNVLAPLGITAASSAIDVGIKKNTWFWE